MHPWWLVLAILPHTQDLPPAYPRPGATAMLDNEQVVVWNIAWLKQEYPLHRHRYDLVGVYYTSGDRVIVSTEGERRPVHTEAWNIAFQESGVTHIEEGASDDPLRAVFIEVKQEGPIGSAGLDGARPAFPVGEPAQRLDNDRVTVWEYGDAGPAAELHVHVHDAVVVSFDASGNPEAHYVERGTTHESDSPSGATRTFVFEIK